MLRALAILTDPQGIDLAPTRITVSTSGVVDAMGEFYKRAPKGIQLAVSVNAPNDQVRSQIMPVNKKWDMKSLYEAMREFDQTILIEYVMLKGINDSLEDAEELTRYLQALKVKINLIPYNSQTKAQFETSSPEQVSLFASKLRSKKISRADSPPESAPVALRASSPLKSMRPSRPRSSCCVAC